MLTAPASRLALGLAIGLDALMGELPRSIHPVVQMGNLIDQLRRRAPKDQPILEFLWGAGMAAGVPSLAALAGWSAWRVLARHGWLWLPIEGVLLSSTFAGRELDRATARVEVALTAPDLARAREALRSLCSRDPSHLDAEQLAGAAIESVAENTSDSVVAPLLFYCLGGLPAALAYRAVNTLDAMIGYHGPFEYLGKASARLDDILNLLPARISALLLIASGALTGACAGRGVRILLRDGSKTESPNAGRPMAAMAGLLGVRLDKRDHYSLGDATRPLTPEVIRQARVICRLAWSLTAAAAIFGAKRGLA